MRTLTLVTRAHPYTTMNGYPENTINFKKEVNNVEYGPLDEGLYKVSYESDEENGFFVFQANSLVNLHIDNKK